MQACGSAHPVLKPVPGSAQRTRLHVPLSSRRAAVQKRKQENVPLSPRRTAAQKRKQENFPLSPRRAAVQKRKQENFPLSPRRTAAQKRKQENVPLFPRCAAVRKRKQKNVPLPPRCTAALKRKQETRIFPCFPLFLCASSSGKPQLHAYARRFRPSSLSISVRIFRIALSVSSAVIVWSAARKESENAMFFLPAPT